MLFILEDVTNVCADYGIANALSIVSKVFTIICIIVPILLILSVTISLLGKVTTPDDKKANKKILQKIAAALVIFFLPAIMNMTIGLLPDSDLDIIACLKSAARKNASNEKVQYTSGIGSDRNQTLMGNLAMLRNYGKNVSDKASEESEKNTTNNNINHDNKEENDSSEGNALSQATLRVDKKYTNDYGQKVPHYAGTSKAAKVLNGAMKYVGVPYWWGGGHAGEKTMESLLKKNNNKGVDCSGFVRIIYTQYAKIKFENGWMTSSSFRTVGEKVSSLKKAKAGDIICYDGHVAIYMGNNKIVHATGENYNGRVVQGTNVSVPHEGKIVAIRRVL